MTTTPPRGRGRSPRMSRASGFSMLELTTALGLFAIGLVAVASIFPVATLLQKQATNDTMSDQVASNVRALIQARKFRHDILIDNDGTTDLPPAIPSDLFVHPILQPGLDPPGILRFTPPNNIYEHWKLNDRSYFLVRENLGYHPKHTTEVPNPNYASAFARRYYWVPLARRTQIPTTRDDWQVFVFILRKDSDTYDRSGIPSGSYNAFAGWANYDGYISIPPNWHVPGVRSVSASVTSSNRFDFDNDRNNDNLPDEIMAGDQILDGNGIIHTVIQADKTGVNVNGFIPNISSFPTALTLWYGRPASKDNPISPTAQIIVVSDAVE